jgi:magnesium chelatase accessory protein
VAARLQWELDGRDWPLRGFSRFVSAAGLRWHLQQIAADGRPIALLLHGTGASTHSWRDLAPLLGRNFSVLSLDLPGHGFTQMPAAQDLSLDAMARAIGTLLETLRLHPALVIGHSAGAAIAARMCLDGLIDPKLVVSLNGALLPLGGLPGVLFPPAARLLAAAPVVPRLFAWAASDRAAVQRLIDGTGSTLDPAGVEYYARLVRNPGHAAAALGMMAHWDLRALQRDLPRLAVPLGLVAGGNDRAVPIERARQVVAMVPGAWLSVMPGLGHLAHEEQPAAVAETIVQAARAAC